MLNGPSIDWPAAEQIYAVYSAIYGKAQTLERIAERGGFGWDEVPLFLNTYRARRLGPYNPWPNVEISHAPERKGTP